MKNKTTIGLLAFLIGFVAIIAGQHVLIKDGTAYYFDYAASATDTSGAIALPDDVTHAWLDYYIGVEASTTVTLDIDFLGNMGGTYRYIHNDAAEQSAITSSTYGRVMIRNGQGDSCKVPYDIFKLRSAATITGDSATVWYVLNGY
jgi:hypothetical protein